MTVYRSRRTLLCDPCAQAFAGDVVVRLDSERIDDLARVEQIREGARRGAGGVRPDSLGR